MSVVVLILVEKSFMSGEANLLSEVCLARGQLLTSHVRPPSAAWIVGPYVAWTWGSK